MQLFIDHLRSLWHWEDFTELEKTEKGWTLVLHTGGWSGNEEIIEALHKTWKKMFWIIFWYQSKRGGHYWFKIPVSFLGGKNKKRK